MNPLVDAVTAVLAEVARTIILPRYKQLAEGEVRAKTHPADFVTIADEESERALSAHLTRLVPGSIIVGEEAVAADPQSLDRLLHHDPLWIVDPIDGTANFVHGNPAFAVMVAFVSKGETRLGWIHDPLTGRTLWAERGQGAWCRTREPSLPGLEARITVPPASTDLKALNAGIYNRDLALAKGKFARIIRHGSAAHDYWALAEGRLHVLAFRRMKPWDHAAGVLIHAEAGGYNRLMTGAPYDPVAREQAALLCAPTREIWQEINALAVAA
jgi:fructose-1,6-bisphosphatase/inositol monophosphatase family enzyme